MYRDLTSTTYWLIAPSGAEMGPYSDLAACNRAWQDQPAEGVADVVRVKTSATGDTLSAFLCTVSKPGRRQGGVL